MLMVVNHIKVFFLSVKYSLMREMLNKTTFLSNVIFMILNNASFILLWTIFYSIKDNVNGYLFKDIVLLWGLASGSYGISHIFFNDSFKLADTIANGKLDAYLVQPKNVLLNSTMGLSSSAFGDLLYAYILLFFVGTTITNFFLYTLFLILGGLIMASVAVIFHSLSFWFGKTDQLGETAISFVTQFSMYPDSIFNDKIKLLFYTVIPVAYSAFIPFRILLSFNLTNFLIVFGASVLIVMLAAFVFYRGLKRYTSSNLMIARV